MIEIFSWPTPNGVKVHIPMEELGISYKLTAVNITRGEQFDPEFLKISPNNKIPAMVDPEGFDDLPYSLFESGSIMIYLAEKTGRFLSDNPKIRHCEIQWLMFEMANVGPMFGQLAHFSNYAPQQIDYAQNRYRNECLRLYNVVDDRLSRSNYLGGEQYSIADNANYSWMHSHERRGLDITAHHNVQRWLSEIGQRPAVIKGCELLLELKR